MKSCEIENKMLKITNTNIKSNLFKLLNHKRYSSLLDNIKSTISKERPSNKWLYKKVIEHANNFLAQKEKIYTCVSEKLKDECLPKSEKEKIIQNSKLSKIDKAILTAYIQYSSVLQELRCSPKFSKIMASIDRHIEEHNRAACERIKYKNYIQSLNGDRDCKAYEPEKCFEQISKITESMPGAYKGKKEIANPTECNKKI